MQNKKISFFTEMGWSGKTPRNLPNMRIEYAWFNVLDADHHNILTLQQLPDNYYDLGIMIIPKEVKYYLNFDIIGQLQRVCKKYTFMQEGPSWFFQDLPLQESLWFYNIMANADFVLAHNDCDKEYYEGLLDKQCFINPTLMIHDLIEDIPNVERNNVIIGGNLVRWYGGFNSLMIALEANNEVWAPKMGRMDESELQLDDLNHLPYLEWDQWIKKLNTFKYAVHMIPYTIGGSFSLNCAYLGIPCIGNINSNTQRLCFPDLSVEPHNIAKAKKLMQKLCKDEEFYVYCSNKAKQLYTENFSETTYRKVWSDIIKQVL